MLVTLFGLDAPLFPEDNDYNEAVRSHFGLDSTPNEDQIASVRFGAWLYRVLLRCRQTGLPVDLTSLSFEDYCLGEEDILCPFFRAGFCAQAGLPTHTVIHGCTRLYRDDGYTEVTLDQDYAAWIQELDSWLQAAFHDREIWAQTRYCIRSVDDPLAVPVASSVISPNPRYFQD